MATNLLSELMNHNAQHVVIALAQEGPLRFNALKEKTGLEQKSLSTKLKQLQKAMIVIATTIPSKGERVWLEYGLSPRGQAMYEVLVELRQSIERRAASLGRADQEMKERFNEHEPLLA